MYPVHIEMHKVLAIDGKKRSKQYTLDQKQDFLHVLLIKTCHLLHISSGGYDRVLNELYRKYDPTDLWYKIHLVTFRVPATVAHDRLVMILFYRQIL